MCVYVRAEKRSTVLMLLDCDICPLCADTQDNSKHDSANSPQVRAPYVSIGGGGKGSYSGCVRVLVVCAYV